MAHQLIGFYTVADSSDGCLKVMRGYSTPPPAISDKVRRCKWKGRVTVARQVAQAATSGTLPALAAMTSFKSAQLIADSHDADKVVFLMDRIELGTQSLSEYRSFADDADDVQGTENTQVLKSKLASDDPKNRLIVTSIQKMSNLKVGESRITQAELDRLAGKRIVFIDDECHLPIHLWRHAPGHTQRLPQCPLLRFHEERQSSTRIRRRVDHGYGVRRMPAPIQHRRRHP